ncbi:MAG: hypothetical protein NTW95_09195 [Candidatus Aminicenantes bacterium]|nr:hypothetical protein [Candidatus Aminicenantes bacterium]
MGKNASKNFVNQFKNTRRQTRIEQKRFVRSPSRPLKKFFPAQPKKEKNPDSGDK